MLLRLRTRLALTLAILLPTVAHAQTNFRVEDIAEVKPDLAPAEAGKERLNIVIVSEGYTDDLKPLFEAKARAIVKELRAGKDASPMRDVNTFDFYRVWVPSSERGAPWRNGEPAGNTPFRARVEKDGSLCTDDGALDRAVKHVAPATGRTIAVALIHLKAKNSPKPRRLPTVDDPNTSPDDVRDISDTPEDLFKHVLEDNHLIGRVHQVDGDMEAFLHEFGHAAYGLDDEYANDPDERVPEKSKGEVAQFPNCTTDPTGTRWRSLVPDLFHPDGRIKQIFEGGSGFGKGVFHAFKNCRMNQSRSMPFCPVCAATIRNSKDRDKTLPEPRWVSPRDGVDVATTATDKARLLPVEWKPGSSEQPNSWHLSLSKNGKVVWKGDVEGHLTTAQVPIPGPGSFDLSIQAERVALANPHSGSDPVAVSFKLAKDGTVARIDKASGLTAAERRLIADRDRATGSARGINRVVADVTDKDKVRAR